MQNHLWAIYNQCVDLPSTDIDRLMSELQILSDKKYENEADNPLHESWVEAGDNIGQFMEDDTQESTADLEARLYMIDEAAATGN